MAPRYLPVEEDLAAEDLFSNYTTPKNYLKSIFFISNYWITLAVLLIAGATKISLFSLGYIIGCFIFLRLGNDAYLMPSRRLIISWTCFIIYAALVILTKIILQFPLCDNQHYLANYCYIYQLLGIVCYKTVPPTDGGGTPGPAATCAASLPYNRLDILWDALCLFYLILQRVVFGRKEFRYLVQEVKAQQILASRGAELILAIQVEEAKAQTLYEKEVMRNIRARIDDLKSENQETTKAWQRILSLPHHHQIIRNANKHLFTSLNFDKSFSQCRTDDWKFRKAFIPDPLGDELERMSEINGISAVLSRWMKGEALYGNGNGNGNANGNGNGNGTSTAASTTSRQRSVDKDPMLQQQQTGASSASSNAPSTSGAAGSGNLQLSGQQQQQQHQSTSELSHSPSYDVIQSSDNEIELQEATSGQSVREQTQAAANECKNRVRSFWDLLNLLVYSCLLSATVELNKLSRSYRYVSRRMAVEKNALKRQFNLHDERFRSDPNWRKWVIGTLSETYARTNEYYQESQSNTSLHRIRSALQAIKRTNGGAGGSTGGHTASGSGVASPGGVQDSVGLTTSSSQQSSPKSPRSPPQEQSRSHSHSHSQSQSQSQQQQPQQQQQQQQQQSTTEIIGDPEYQFLKLNMFTQFCRAFAYVLISNTSLLCQLVIILNQVVTASLLSLPLPLLTFLWGTLSVPRPTKRFWKLVITYTELIVVIKYTLQFPIWEWDTNNINPFYYPNLLGIKNITILYDLSLLLVLFFHRSMLKSLGQWDVSDRDDFEEDRKFENLLVDLRSSPSSDRQELVTNDDQATLRQRQQQHQQHSHEPVPSNTPIPMDINPTGVILNQRLVRSSEFVETNVDGNNKFGPTQTEAINLGSFESEPDMNKSNSMDIDQALKSKQKADYYIENSYQNQPIQEIKLTLDSDDDETDSHHNGHHQESRNCLVRAYHRSRRSVLMFFRHVLNNPYVVQTDVYTWMFICDFINFLILIYGFWAFGSGYTNQTVASFLNENRIPFSVLIMLLAQFASIIIDRAFYLQKNIASKLVFQVILVIGIHIWLFFALPFTTGHTLTLKEYWPPKAWYVFKSIYFLLSAYQIRCGYPRRVLGNCLTKGYGYTNWAAFKIYRAIPLVYDLRLYMDWIWTETTLEFRNWNIMEDMFANLFIRKCELTLEEEYPIPRARPIRHLSKYLTGGAFILLILAIIWGPLLLFSMGKTVGESNPPVELEYELEFVGFQPILRMRATTQQISMLTEQQYDQMKSKFVSLSSQSFLGDYKVGDVAAIRLDGQSNAVWEISPPSKELLMSRIRNNETITLKSSWTVFRIKKEKSQNFDASVAGSYQQVIPGNSSQAFRGTLLDMLANSSTTTTPNTAVKSVISPAIFPNYIRVPETGQASLVEQFYDNLFEYNPLRSLSLSYIRMFDLNINLTDNATSWWKADDLCKASPANDSFPFWSDQIAPLDGQLEHCDSLLVIAFNDRIFTGILALLSAPGIIGLYTTFVVFFARLIRAEPSGKVIYTEIPNVDRVYNLIMVIYMARECGEFELEEKLFAELLFLYRSPEMLIEFSKREDEPDTALMDLEQSSSNA